MSSIRLIDVSLDFDLFLPVRILDFSRLGQGGIKHVAATGIWEWLQYLKSDELKRVDTIVMESSGNAGVAMCQKVLQEDKAMVVVVSSISEPGKITLLENVGAKVCFPLDNETPLECTERLASQDGWLNVNQYCCEGNWLGHAKYTGPAISMQMLGKSAPDVLVVATGSCCTLVGLDSWRSALTSRPKLVAARTLSGERVPVARDCNALKNVSFYWREAADAEYDFSSKESYRISKELADQKLSFGPSTGLALFAGMHEKNSSPDSEVALIGADSADAYSAELKNTIVP